MTPETAVALAAGLPLAGGLLLLALGRWPNLRETVTLVTGGALLAVVASLVPIVASGGRPGLRVVELMPGLSLGFTVEPLGLLFALVASSLWIATSCYSIGYLRAERERRQTRYYVWFAVAIAGAMIVAFAGDLLTLFVGYEILTFSTFPLVTHHGTDEAVRAGRTYLGILVGTSVALLLTALVWTWQVAGTLDFRAGGILGGRIGGGALAGLFALYVFGTAKAAVMPVHRWLPAAMVAPTPVSALLHAVAVVKAGVFSILKVVVYVFGPATLCGTAPGAWIGYVAAATIVIASLVALRQDNLKRRLAYSTVSQLSYIVLGATLANPLGIVGGAMHIAMHAFGKITLFFCAGSIHVAAHKTEISTMRGIGRAMPVTMAAFLVGSVSVIGIPPMGGAWGKWFLALGAVEAKQAVLVAVLMIGSLLNVAYLMPIVARGFFQPDAAGGEPPRVREAPLWCLVPLCVTALGCIVLFFYADAIYDLILPITRG